MKRIVVAYCFLAVGLFSVGCSNDADHSLTATSQEQTVAPSSVNPDNASAVEALKAIGAETKSNADGQIVEINLRNTEATDDTLAAIVPLRHVKALLLNDLGITDAGLKALSAAEWPLANLDLRGCPISNTGVEHVVEFPTLRALRLSGDNSGTTVDDGAAPSISQLPNLKALALDKLWITGDGLKQLLPLSNLEELYLAETTVDDDALVHLSEFAQLKKLRLSRNQITDDGVAHLAGIGGLTELDLSENARLTDAGMTHLSALKNLQKLNLWRVPIGNDGVQALASLTRLTWLNLDNTTLSDDGLTALQDMSQLSFLHLGSTLITDAGLSSLTELKNLKDLKVTRTAVTEQGVAELQKSLPDTTIQIRYLGD